MESDKLFLRRAIKIAGEGIKNGGGPFGAVVSRKGAIISEAINKVVLNSDPTAHAEILALRQAADVLKSHNLSDCVIYSSCEPCPMCLGAIYWSGIKKVVYACDRLDAAEAGFSDNHIYNEILMDPADRSVTFLQITDKEGKDVFIKWNELDKKVPY